MNKKIMIIAGEVSGDLHGANLVKALKEHQGNIEICGVGGERMLEAGVEIYYPLADLAVVGFIEVLKNFRKFKQIFNYLLEKIDSQKIDAVILIDYPGFNLRFAKEIKKRGIPIIYYISPQVWAWGGGRIETIKELVDKMIVVFQFEEKLYRENGIDAHFVGHPLLDMVRPSMSKEDFIRQNNLSKENLTIGLLPGSREQEVKRILPIMLKTAEIIHKQLPNTQFLILKSPTLPEALFHNLNKGAIPATLITNTTYDLQNNADFMLVASGTATLETAILEKPMAILYKVSFLSWLLAKSLIRIPNIGLVNVVAGKRIVPEFVQYNASPKKIAQKVLHLLGNPTEIQKIKSDLALVKEKLGAPGASGRAAEIISDSFR